MEPTPELKTISLLQYDEVPTNGSSLLARLFVSGAPYNISESEQPLEPYIVVQFVGGKWVAYTPYGKDAEPTWDDFEEIAMDFITESEKLDGSVGKLFNKSLKAIASPLNEGPSDGKWVSFEYVEVTDLNETTD